MKLRLISRALVPLLVIIVGSALVVRSHLAQSHQGQSTAPTSTAQAIDLGGAPAPDFTLVDQNGATVSLGDLRGHPVVLTFLYTHCPDACPLTAEKLHAAAERLGARAADVRWLVVSVDPQGDTPASATQFVAAHHLTGHMRYLLGSQARLQPVWDAYHIGVQPGQDAQVVLRSVSHSVGLYTIDKQGREIAYYDQSFDPQGLAADLLRLLS